MRPHAGPYGTAKAGLRQEAEAPPHHFATESWWASGLSREAFKARQEAEALRMRNSRASSWVDGVQIEIVIKYLGGKR